MATDSNAAGLASYFEIIIWSMVIKAPDRATREKVFAAGQLAMRAWPTGSDETL
jgi:hypothetical protein